VEADLIAAAELLKAWPDDTLGENGAHIRTVIETGMFVTYARAFTQSDLGKVNPSHDLTPEQRSLASVSSVTSGDIRAG
jgi:hypothetical protein